MTKFFVLPTFVLFGVAIPSTGWASFGWRGPLLAVAVLLRRPPVVLALARWLHPLRTRTDVAFTAWFEPIGVSTIVYATFGVQRTGVRWLWPDVSLVLFASLVAHGLSATPVSRPMPPDTAVDGPER